MSKIFEFNPQKGYIDQVSGTVGVNTAGTIERTEKGMAWRGDGSSSRIDNYNTLQVINNFSININFKFGNELATGYLFSSTSFRIYTNTAKTFNIEYKQNSPSAYKYFASPPAIEDGWHNAQVIMDDGDIELYIDGVYNTHVLVSDLDAGIAKQVVGAAILPGAAPCSSNIQLIQVYDHVLTSSERAKLLNEFNNSHPVSRTIR